MRSVVFHVAKNTGIIIAGNLINTLLGMVSVVLLARYLGADGFGLYSLVLVYLGFFGIIINSGSSSIVLREMSRDESKIELLAGNAIMMRLAFSCFAMFCALILINFFHQSKDIKAMVYIASLSFLTSFGTIYNMIFQRKLKMIYPVIIGVISTILKLGMVFMLVSMKVRLFWFVCAVPVMEIPGLVLLIFFSGKFFRPKFQIDLKMWWYLLKESWPILLTSTFITIYTRIDQVMLYKMKGSGAVGEYAAAVKIAEAFGVIAAAFMTTVYPLFSEYFVTSAEKLKRAYVLSFKCMSLVIIPIAVGVFLLSEPIVKLVYGDQYLKCASTLSILIWSEVFVFLGTVHLSILVSVGLQKLDFIFTSTGAAINIILNLLLIPHYGIAGAAVATVISYGLGVPMSCALKSTRKYGMAMLYSMGRPLLAAAFMGAAVYFMRSAEIPLILMVISGVVLYLVFMVLFKGLEKDEWEYFKQLLTSR